MAILSLNQIYASGGQLPIVTLEINNSEIGTLRFVLAYEDKTISGNEYKASAFTVQLPDSRILLSLYAVSQVSAMSTSSKH